MTRYYVDTSNTAGGRDGSSGNPWNGIAEACSAGSFAASGDRDDVVCTSTAGGAEALTAELSAIASNARVSFIGYGSTIGDNIPYAIDVSTNGNAITPSNFPASFLNFDVAGRGQIGDVSPFRLGTQALLFNTKLTNVLAAPFSLGNYGHASHVTTIRCGSSNNPAVVSRGAFHRCRFDIRGITWNHNGPSARTFDGGSVVDCEFLVGTTGNQDGGCVELPNNHPGGVYGCSFFSEKVMSNGFVRMIGGNTSGGVVEGCAFHCEPGGMAYAIYAAITAPHYARQNTGYGITAEFDAANPVLYSTGYQLSTTKLFPNGPTTGELDTADIPELRGRRLKAGCFF